MQSDGYQSPFSNLLRNHVGIELCFHKTGTSCMLMCSSSLPEYTQLLTEIHSCLELYEEEDRRRRIRREENGEWVSSDVVLFRNKSVLIGMKQHGVQGYVQTWVQPTFTFALLSSPTLEIVADLNFLLRHTSSWV